VFNERYLEVLQHYGIEASKNTLGNTHENGDVESAHRHFKRAMVQRLRLRGMRGIASLEQYEAFLHQVVPARNPQPQERLTEELAVMRPLPVRPLPAWREDFATVTRWSTVRIARKAYSVKQDHPPAAQFDTLDAETHRAAPATSRSSRGTRTSPIPGVPLVARADHPARHRRRRRSATLTLATPLRNRLNRTR